MTERDYLTESYKRYQIKVFVERFDKTSAWTVKVQVTDPDGADYPSFDDADNSFTQKDIAFASGLNDAHKMIDDSDATSV